MRVVILAVLACSIGCGGAVIEPGHRGLVFDPAHGGLRRESLAPGYYHLGSSARIEDFDVTYSTQTETLHALTREAISVDAQLSIIYRPIISELYELDTEIGPKYYEEVVAPEFRSASRATLARHSITELNDSHLKLEDEIENELRLRVKGKHVEITSVTLGNVQLPPELVAAIKRRIEVESLAAADKKAADAAWEKEKTELEHDVERRRLKREAEGAH